STIAGPLPHHSTFLPRQGATAGSSENDWTELKSQSSRSRNRLRIVSNTLRSRPCGGRNSYRRLNHLPAENICGRRGNKREQWPLLGDQRLHSVPFGSSSTSHFQGLLTQASKTRLSLPLGKVKFVKKMLCPF